MKSRQEHWKNKGRQEGRKGRKAGKKKKEPFPIQFPALPAFLLFLLFRFPAFLF